MNEARKRVKFNTSVAGEFFSFDEGKQYVLAATEADQYVSVGYAEFVEEKLECAAVGAPENAIQQRPPFRGNRR